MERVFSTFARGIRKWSYFQAEELATQQKCRDMSWMIVRSQLSWDATVSVLVASLSAIMEQHARLFVGTKLQRPIVAPGISFPKRYHLMCT